MSARCARGWRETGFEDQKKHLAVCSRRVDDLRAPCAAGKRRLRRSAEHTRNLRPVWAERPLLTHLRKALPPSQSGAEETERLARARGALEQSMLTLRMGRSRSASRKRWSKQSDQVGRRWELSRLRQCCNHVFHVHFLQGEPRVGNRAAKGLSEKNNSPGNRTRRKGTG